MSTVKKAEQLLKRAEQLVQSGVDEVATRIGELLSPLIKGELSFDRTIETLEEIQAIISEYELDRFEQAMEGWIASGFKDLGQLDIQRTLEQDIED